MFWFTIGMTVRPVRADEGRSELEGREPIVVVVEEREVERKIRAELPAVTRFVGGQPFGLELVVAEPYR